MRASKGVRTSRIAGHAATVAAAGMIPLTMGPLTMGALAEASAQTLVPQMLVPQTLAAATPAPIFHQTVTDTPEASPAADAATATAPAPTDDGDETLSASKELDPELVCMAKVVQHEAGSEPRAGKLAVAQLIIKRIRSGRFPATACGVANQRGQFFDTASYNPARDSEAWQNAVAVSLEAMAGTAAEVAPGALFFRSSAGTPSSFFRSRARVATIGRQVFYR